MVIRTLAWALTFTLAAPMLAGAVEERPPAVNAHDLMDRSLFPEASYGMEVESVADGAMARVLTTGAEFVIWKADSVVECRQRIAKGRSVARLQFPQGSFEGISLSFRASGTAIFEGVGTTLRINGDSLLMVSPGTVGPIVATMLFTPDYYSEYLGNFNFFDPYGGISFAEHGNHPDAVMVAYEDPVTVTWNWRPGDVFWAGVSPPKPFDWDATVEQRVVRCGSSADRYRYPTDLELRRFHDVFGSRILHIQEPGWNQWQLDLTIPDTILDDLRRTIRTAHELGMKVIPYASPHYFLKGSEVEDRAQPGGASGWDSGSNEDVYLEAADRLLDEYGFDGLYFDAMYSSRRALAVQYHLSRSARDMVGDKGILTYHATTDDLGHGHHGAYFPTLHAYFNIIWKGEGEENKLGWPRGYTRYYLSTYNISNVVAAQYLPTPPPPEKIDYWLDNNVWFFLTEFWRTEAPLFQEHYYPRLNPSLQDEIEPRLLQRVGAFDDYRESINRGLARQ